MKMKIFTKIFIVIILIYNSLFADSINDELFKKAERYFNRNKFTKAIPIYENLFKEDDLKNRELLLFHLGYSYNAFQKFDKSYMIFTQLLDEYPDTIFLIKSLKMMVNYLNKKKDKNKALELLNKKQSKNKGNIEITEMILGVYEYNEDYVEALDLLEKKFPDNYWFIRKKVSFLQEMKQYGRAITFIKNVIQKYKRKELYQALADLYELKGDFDNSMIYYDKLYKQTGNNNYLINEARMLLANNQIKKSESVIKKIFKKFGDNKSVYKRVAKFYQEFGLYDDLLKLYKKGIKKGYDFKKEKINVYEVIGQYEKAVYEYMELLDKSNIGYISKKILDIALYEEQFPLIERTLIKNEDKFEKKRDLIIKLEVNFYLKFNKYDKIFHLVENKYFNQDKVDHTFLETVMNALFESCNYGYIVDIYKSIPKKMKSKISPVVKLRYAQSLYLNQEYNKSLNILKDFKNKALYDIVNYYKALNHIKLNQYNQAVKFLKDSANYESFNLYIRVLILKNELSYAGKIIKKELKRKKYPRSSLFFDEILVNLYLKEYVILLKDIKKYLEIYPQAHESNDLLFLQYLLNNEFIKNNKDNKAKVLSFFKYYYMNNYSKSINILKSLSFQDDNLESVRAFYHAKSLSLYTKYNDAIIQAKNAITKDTFVKPYALELIGWIYHYKINNKTQAKKYYKNILAKYPSFININNIRKLMLE